VRELRGFPETMQSPLHPVIALYESLCGFEAADTLLVKLAKLRDLLETRAPTLVGHGLPLLARMLGLSGASVPSLPESTPEKLRAATHALLIDMLDLLEARQPVLIVVEDLHWIDISTLELLSMLVANRRQARIFLLMTARPALTPDWPGIETMPLAPLPDAAIADMVDALCADMPPERQARIVARADGVPLFAEELAAMAQERELPANLHDLLMVRLDGLGPARTIAQLAATVGREFDLDFLGRIADFSAAALQQAIGRLQESGLVQQLADERLQFKHALVQEAAYQSQTRAARRTTHRRIAQLLETGYREVAAHQPELLAQHWSAAGEASKAVHYWLAAGRHAAAKFAHREAISHYDAGLELLAKLADDMERNRLEAVLLVNLGKSEQTVVGHEQRRSGALLVRAVALLERGAGDGADLFNALWGLWESSGSQASYEETARLARRLLDIAEKEGSRILLQQGHYAMGNSFFWIGKLAEARRHLEQSIALEDKKAQSPTRDSYGRLVMVSAQAFLSWVLWLLGLSDQAVAQSEAAVVLARRFDHRNSLAYALTFAAILQRWLGNTDETLRLAEEGRAVSASCQSVIFEPINIIGIGWASVMRGDASAIASIEQGVNLIRNVMNGAAASMLAPFAEALLHLGEAEKALAIANEALQLIEEKHDRYYLAELHRIKGMCLLQQRNKSAARACFDTAIAVSQAQGAVAFELRTRECLARHWP
jgi:tetratricopeptide (TPR) repeat protein